MNNDFLRSLLKKKTNNSTEIELHLFEFCNLSCVFCGQDHDSKVGFDTIIEKSYDVIKFMQKSHLSSHIINVMGGEIFNDMIEDSLFKSYQKFAENILSYAKDSDQKVTINWVTNLIFKKKERVHNLLSKLRELNLNVNLSTSYDFDGRGYAGKVNSIFAKNIYEFKDYIYTVGFVLTSPAIKNLLNLEDLFFEKMYKDFILYFDYYVPEEKSCELLMPSDEELYNAFVYIATHYPNVYPVSDWLKNKENKMTCFSLNKTTILPDGRQVTCRYLDYKKGSFQNKIDYSSNANIVESYLNENECLSCEWYNRCSMRCFVQADWAKREKMSGCLYKKFFNAMELEK